MATYYIYGGNNSYMYQLYPVGSATFINSYNNNTVMTVYDGRAANYLSNGTGQAYTAYTIYNSTKGGNTYSNSSYYYQINSTNRTFNFPTIPESEIITSASLQMSYTYLPNVSSSVTLLMLIIPNSTTEINPLKSAFGNLVLSK